MALRLAICLSLVLAPSAFAKQDTTALVLGHPHFGARPGTQIQVAWKLEQGGAQAASADSQRYYVRLFSKTGASSTHAYGKLRGRHYTARVRVPRGGVGDMEIRLVGWAWEGWQVPRRSDASVPILNDPFEISVDGSQAR